MCHDEFSVDNPPHVDHDHSCCPTKKRSCGSCTRELLCRLCNLGLGYFRDNIELLEAAQRYLTRHKGTG